MTPAAPPSQRPGPRRSRDARRRPSGRRAVDDQHGHRGRRRHRAAGRARSRRPARNWCAITVNTEEAAAAVPRDSRHASRTRHATCRWSATSTSTATSCCANTRSAPRALAKYRINPGNVGRGSKRDPQFADDDRDRLPSRQAGAHRRQLGQPRPGPADAHDGRELARRRTASTRTTWCARRWSSPRSRAPSAPRNSACRTISIVISCKVSGVQDLIAVYRNLAARCDYPLHLGLTEAGMGSKGIVASTAAMAVLLQEGIGDTIRVSLTPEPRRRSHAMK